jgi:hypothetical protein
MRSKAHVPDDSHWTDAQRERFWEKHQPEEFADWAPVDIRFVRAPKKLVQVRLDPADARQLDREAQRTGIDRSQLVRAWVKERLRKLARAS